MDTKSKTPFPNKILTVNRYQISLNEPKLQQHLVKRTKAKAFKFDRSGYEGIYNEMIEKFTADQAIKRVAAAFQTTPGSHQLDLDPRR